MANALEHACTITQHREHAMVDIAVMHSLLDLLGREIDPFVLRLYRVSNVKNQLQIALTAWVDGNEVRNEETDCETANLPQGLVQALKEKTVCTGTMTDAQDRMMHATWLPVSRDEELLGCIEFGMTTPLSQDQLPSINGVCRLYGNYLSLLYYSQIDTLTKLLNRKTFDESLHSMLTAVPTESPTPAFSTERRSEVQEPANWLAVMDIDHFKRVNDGFGHLFGDEVLILVADLLRKTFRRKDKLFRFGGEEFVVLLRDTDERNVLLILDRFRDSIEQHVFPQLGNVTISIGVTRVRPVDTPPALLGRADEALYYAKNNGRNQVQFFDTLETEGKIVHSHVVHTNIDLF
jgi:diguanylate cyclase (GGDEF)-like protein